MALRGRVASLERSGLLTGPLHPLLGDRGDGDETSTGVWHDLPYSAADTADGEYLGGYYFSIRGINGVQGVGSLNVDRVVQDTSAADG